VIIIQTCFDRRNGEGEEEEKKKKKKNGYFGERKLLSARLEKAMQVWNCSLHLFKAQTLDGVRR